MAWEARFFVNAHYRFTYIRLHVFLETGPTPRMSAVNYRRMNS